MADLIFGLEREYFVGDKLFEAETEKVFAKNWLCVGRAEEFDSNFEESYRRVSVGPYDIVIVRRSDASFAAFHNVCSHRGTRLLDQPAGGLKNSCVTCPYHAWTYDLDGCLIGAPNMHENDSFDRQQHGLNAIACVNWNGFLMVHLSQTELEFETEFAPIIERIADWNLDEKVVAKTLTYDVKANWKVIFQNYSECYHCPTVHPDLNRLTPYRGATNDLESGPILGGPMGLSDDCETVSTDGKRIAPPFKTLDEEQQRCVYYYTLFPAMFVSAHPDYVMIHDLTRVSNSQTIVKCHFFVTKETKPDDLARAVKTWDDVNQQDWQVCELTQLGIQSPAYRPGPYSNLEPMLIAFDRHYRSAMS